MPRIHLRLARFLQRLAEPSTPRRPARVRISPRHPRPTAKATIRAAERARMRRAKQAHPREGRALQAWTAVGTVLAGVAAVPALFIALNALEISEQQAALAAQQFANGVTNVTSPVATLTKGLYTISGPTNTLTMQNSNTVPVVVEVAIPQEPRENKRLWGTLTIRVPACTEADFSIDLPDDIPSMMFRADWGVMLALRNTIDGRLWSVPDPGEQARIVERTWPSPLQLPDIGPEQTRKASPCV